MSVKKNWTFGITLRNAADASTPTTQYKFSVPPPQNVMADRDPFTQRIATAESLATLTDYGYQQQESFHNGAGFISLIDLAGYRIGNSIDPRNPGIVTVFPKPREVTVSGLTPVRPDSAVEQVIPYPYITYFRNSYTRFVIGGEGGVWAINPIPYDSWKATKSYPLYTIVVPTQPGNYIYIARTAGATGGAEPTWPTTPGGLVTDGAVQWVAQTMKYNHNITWAWDATNFNGVTTEKSVLDIGEDMLVGLLDEVMLKFSGNLDRFEGVWSPKRPYQLGDFITPVTANGFFYEATTVTAPGHSGTTEPSWTTAAGATFAADGNITWTCRHYWARVNGDATWRPKQNSGTWPGKYNLGDVVRPSTPTGFYYEQTNTGASGATEPATWNTPAAATTTDGNLTWTTGQYDQWAVGTKYVVGDRVRGLAVANNFFFEVVQITGEGLTHASTEPAWPATAGQTIVDNQVTWKVYKPVWVASTSYAVGDIITRDAGASGNGYYFTLTLNEPGNSGTTEPTWPTTEGGNVSDNTLRWTARREQDAPVDMGCFTTYDGYIWTNQHFRTGASKYRTLVGSLLHYFQDTTGQDAAGYTNRVDSHPLFRTNGDPGAVTVGRPYGRVVKMVGYGDTMYVFRKDGISTVNQVEGVFESKDFNLDDIKIQAHRDNGVVSLRWNGELWFNIRNKLYRFTGSTQNDKSIPVFDREIYPPTSVQRIHGAVAVGRFLYVIADEDLWCTDGTAWHRLTRIVPLANTIIQASIGYQEANFNNPSTLFVVATYGASTSFEGATDFMEDASNENTRLYLWSFGQNIEYPSTDNWRNTYTDVVGELETSRMDAAFLNIPKAWLSVTAHGAFYNIPSNPQLNGWSQAKVEVYVDTLNSSTRELYGGGDLDAMRIDQDILGAARLAPQMLLLDRGKINTGSPYEEFLKEMLIPYYPGGSPGPYLDPFTASKHLKLTFKLYPGTKASSREVIMPALFGYSLKLVVRPKTVRGWQIIVDIADNSKHIDGAKTGMSGEEMKLVLEAARDSIVPFYLDDNTHRRTGWVYVSSIRFQPVGEHAQGRANETVEQQAILSLVEMVFDTTDN